MSNYFSNVRSDVIGLLPSRRYSRILEVGGGEFPTLTALQKTHGGDAWGVDVYPTSNRDINFVHGSIEDDDVLSKLPDESFDLIIANDVIEHLFDTEKFFRSMRSKLKSDGLLALSVPNIRQLRLAYFVLLRGTFPRHDAGLFDRTHVRWFCKSDVKLIAKRNGFDVITAYSVGRLVPRMMRGMSLSEFFALQNLFLLSRASEQ